MIFGLTLGLVFGSVRPLDMTRHELEGIVREVCDRHKAPAVAACLVQGHGPFVSATYGVRKLGSKVKTTLGDTYTIGSCTKSFTALLAAQLVEEGTVSWQTTVGEAFPALRIDPRLTAVTLEDLLFHRSGLKGDLSEGDMERYTLSKQPGVEQRSEAVAALLSQPPAKEPRSELSYSNLGYCVAGHILEVRTKSSWESLVKSRIFEPLHMKSAGFGFSGTPGKIDQPWGHLAKEEGGYTPVPPGPEADNPVVLAPAATIHCSIEDLARYAKSMRDGLNGQPGLVSRLSIEKLASDPYEQGYGMGWIVGSRKWTNGRAVFHAGSNTMSTALIWVVPGRDLAIVVTTNIGDDNSFKVCDDVVKACVERLYGIKP